MQTNHQDNILWRPSDERVRASNLHHFTTWLAEKTGKDFPTYESLHQFSCDQVGEFWSHVWDYMGVIGDKGKIAVAHPDRMPHANFFPESSLNFAENILQLGGETAEIFFMGEDGRGHKKSHAAIISEVMQMARALESFGVQPGDRVAAFMPNIPETIIAMLATSSIGAVFTSCSPDFGVPGVLDRFGQTTPRVLIACDGYHYAGKKIDTMPKILEMQKNLPSLEKTIIVPFLHPAPAIDNITNGILWGDAIKGRDATPRFTPLPFDQPLFIMYSSGTTGVPKCIVHGAGGVLLKFMVEQRLHCDLKPGDRIFFFSTCGWMMWNWLLGCLHTGAAVCLFDGSPLYPTPAALWDYAEQYEFTHFGTSAKYIDSIKKADYHPGNHHGLKNLRMVLTTGSPLAPESFDFLYQSVKSDMQVASISGGTDILGCFLAGLPTAAVVRGELQSPVLGMAVQAFDDHDKPIASGKGELVCVKPFPSMPVYFWNDDDGKKYHKAYFDKYDNVWYHGDYLEITNHQDGDHGYIIHGRSDATLNPGGVRIGTAEIYRQVEQLPEVLESIVIGQDWQDDVRVVLFVKMKSGATLDDNLKTTIKKTIRDNCSPRHVPAKIIGVVDIPRTKSGKITEIAVRDTVMGRAVNNKEALLNPEALDYFCNLEELKK
ncbi:MAG: acetoacetate--CoA ligase [Hydrotalea sp.]|nr:acetoacetate--CoA ligase [Hydrotalea sp.]